jgi:hypothetical protein
MTQYVLLKVHLAIKIVNNFAYCQLAGRGKNFLAVGEAGKFHIIISFKSEVHLLWRVIGWYNSCEHFLHVKRQCPHQNLGVCWIFSIRLPQCLPRINILQIYKHIFKSTTASAATVVAFIFFRLAFIGACLLILFLLSLTQPKVILKIIL